MIDKYRLDDLRLESGEKGELARWVIQLQRDLDSERRKAGNSPVIPDGWVAVPVEPTEEMIKAYRDTLYSGESAVSCIDLYMAMIAAAPQQEVKRG